MDLKNVGRNDPCPCGSGKKFKRCHLGREQELLSGMLEPDPAEIGRATAGLPPLDHKRAWEMADKLQLKSAAGKEIRIKLVDIGAYQGISPKAQSSAPAVPEGVLISPQKTKPFDPGHIYIALSPQAGDSTLIHQLAHAADYVEGSGLHPGIAQALSEKTRVPAEILEHSQEFGDRLIALSEQYAVDLDAEDEIVAFLARRQLLLPGKLIATSQGQELTAAAEKLLRFMQENQEEIDARIRNRQGYLGKKANKK